MPPRPVQQYQHSVNLHNNLLVNNIDMGVPVPTGRRTNPDSFPNQIAILGVGESASRSIRIPAEEASWVNIQAAYTKLTQGLQHQILRARKKTADAGTEHNYTSSRGDFRNATGDVFVTVVVTCTE